MADRKVVVAAHGHCFDGLVSAALFTHLRRSLSPGPCQFRYLSCGYGPNMQTVPEAWLRGDENAIVDFRYSPSDRLSWYFDHHATAFASEAERTAALAKPGRVFYDPTYPSCAKLVADVGQQRFGIDFTSFAALVAWADRIDAASFPTVEDAIDRSSPVMQLAAVIEQHGQGALFDSLIGRLTQEPLDDVARSEQVQTLWAPLAQAHEAVRERVARAAELKDKVVYLDLHDAPLGTSGKFYHYAVCPEAVFSVSIVRMKQHYKVSVGFNPWALRPNDHDIAAICRRHGGGGHPDVGAVSFALDKIAEARAVAAQIVAELNGAEPAG